MIGGIRLPRLACTALGLNHGHLIYAKGNEEPARHVVRRSGIEILCHAIDLSLGSEPLLAQIRDLAERIADSRLVVRATYSEDMLNASQLA